MYCSINGSCLYHRKAMGSFIVLCIILLCGCSQSAHKVSFVDKDPTALQTMSQDAGMTPLQSKTPQELVSAGYVYLANNNTQISELHFTTAIEKDPENVEAYVGLGQIRLRSGSNLEALAIFSKAREINPDYLPALIGETRALRAEGKLDSAIEKVNAAMQINPQDIDVLRELAMIYDLMGKENLSASLYQEIVDMAPDLAGSHNNLGLNHMVRGAYPEAILSFLQAHELDRKNNRIKNNLASAYLLNGEEKKAINIFKGTVGEAAAYNNIGYLYMTQGNYQEAERSFIKAMQLRPSFYVRAQENLDKLRILRQDEQTSQ